MCLAVSLQGKDMYMCIKAVMEDARSKTKFNNVPNMELGGEFPVEDIVTGEGGLLTVNTDGVEVLFADRKVSTHTQSLLLIPLLISFWDKKTFNSLQSREIWKKFFSRSKTFVFKD